MCQIVPAACVNTSSSVISSALCVSVWCWTGFGLWLSWLWMMSHSEKAFDIPHCTPFKTHWNFSCCEVSQTHKHSNTPYRSKLEAQTLFSFIQSLPWLLLYWFSFTVCLIHSQSEPATASTSNTFLHVYRPYSSTTCELSGCIFHWLCFLWRRSEDFLIYTKYVNAAW